MCEILSIHGQWLVVGAGGIGCELLKNLVLMGVGCNPDGSITVTDMDTVSRVNLPDQTLYQLSDVGRPKSPTAARALRSINSSAQVHALQERFESETENIFDSSFFESISGIFVLVPAYPEFCARCHLFLRTAPDDPKCGTLTFMCRCVFCC